jgi:hypothetical protein
VRSSLPPGAEKREEDIGINRNTLRRAQDRRAWANPWGAWAGVNTGQFMKVIGLMDPFLFESTHKNTFSVSRFEGRDWPFGALSIGNLWMVALDWGPSETRAIQGLAVPGESVGPYHGRVDSSWRYPGLNLQPDSSF